MYALEDPQEVETFIAFFSTDCINVDVNTSNYQDLVRYFFYIASYFGCTIPRPAIWADLRFYQYLSVTAIRGFCDGIYGVIQGIPGGDNGA